ncbi:MAG: FG-GAP repeat domain-containing protein [Ktedonobacteraceae bacterium]
MQSRRIPHYRSVEYQPPGRPDAQYTIRHPAKQLEQVSQPLAAPLYYDDEDVPRYNGPIPKRRATQTQEQTIHVHRPVAPANNTKRWSWSWGYFFIGAIFFLSLYLFIAGVAMPWVQGLENHWTYGQDGVFHMQAYLKQGDTPDNPSDLYAYIAHGVVVVTVVQDGSVKTYPLIVQGSSTSGFLVTLEVRDMNGDGKPDILVRVSGLTVIMWNNGTLFQGTKP